MNILNVLLSLLYLSLGTMQPLFWTIFRVLAHHGVGRRVKDH